MTMHAFAQINMSTGKVEAVTESSAGVPVEPNIIALPWYIPAIMGCYWDAEGRVFRKEQGGAVVLDVETVL